MPQKELSARPNLEQYKKQAKELLKNHAAKGADSLARFAQNHPRFQNVIAEEIARARVSLTDAQLVLAREHGFESWPKFAKQIEAVNIARSIEEITDPVASFIVAAVCPRDAYHGSGQLDEAEKIREKFPRVAAANIYTAAILADELLVRDYLARDRGLATAKGGPYDWDALSHLCFSRYLLRDASRSGAFVRTARLLLDAGASADTGWMENDNPPKGTWESVMYGAAGLAQNPAMTRLLLEYGADPNDGETEYHVPETYDNKVLEILVESGKLTERSLAWMLLRKCDWHDEAGLKYLLAHGANPNLGVPIGYNSLQHGLRRDNGLIMIEELLDHGADPLLKNERDGRSAVSIAARRGRGDVLHLLEQRGIGFGLEGVEKLIAACAMANRERIRELASHEPALVPQLIAEGGEFLAEFAGNANADGMRCLFELGVSPTALYGGDPYFEIAKESTALHVAAWRAWPAAVKELIARGSPINALDGEGRTALQLAVKATVDSYWKRRRTTESIEALQAAGATLDGVEIPCGWDEADAVLLRYVK
jgi:ankyrin repeat protein